MEIIVTDVTHMRPGHICVAGWDPVQKRMVRPLSGPGQHWTENMVGTHLFEMGNVVRLVPSTLGSTRGLPHSREDLIVKGAPTRVGTLPRLQLPPLLAESESPSVRRLFAGFLMMRRYVREGSDCPSLGAVSIRPERMQFVVKQRDRGPQLRCRFQDAEGQSYDFPVVSCSLRARYDNGGLRAVEALRGAKRHAHVRLGLANRFPDSPNCTVMVNNILFH